MPKGDKLKPKQKKFADKYIENGGNATQAVKEVYNVTTDLSARSIGCENLTKPNIQAYLADKGFEAGSRIERLAKESKNEKIQLDANKFIYEQAVGKAIQKVENKISGELSIREILDDIIK